MKDRARTHRNDLDAGKHGNRFLQFAWRKHGAAAFRFEILERCAEVDLVTRERAWIEKLGSWAPKGFNVMDPAEPGRHAAKAFVVTDPLGQAHRIVNLHKWCRDRGTPGWSPNLAMVAQATKPSHFGWTCRHATERASAWRLRIAELLAARRQRRAAKHNRNGYVVVDPAGFVHAIPYKGLTAWCASRGLSAGALTVVARGKAAHHKGFVARKAEAA